jgi:asparagine synthase (glutamine-hydrolysing)
MSAHVACRLRLFTQDGTRLRSEGRGAETFNDNMCGIAGYAGQIDLAAGQSILRRMADVLAHRGPDGEGYLQATAENGRWQIGLAHRRLAIIDLATGQQPLANETGRISVVFNGEIYNFAALRARLSDRGHRFATASDTEVVVHAYEEYGDACVQHLRGMFAFALWDADKERLLLARDRFGEKPLFFAWIGRTLAFGSEIKALCAFPGVAAVLDQEALLLYLQYRYVPGPGTLLRGVYKLPPGTVASWRRGVFEQHRYYQPPDALPRDPHRTDAPTQGFRARFEDAVRAMMVSDVPYGAFLSGGIDSSAIVAMMARHAAAPVKTFSVGFRESGYSELGHAERVARTFSTEHHELLLTPGDIMQRLPQAARLRDAPVAEPADVPILMLSEAASRSVKMVLTGEGSDECLAGYPKHRAEQYAGGYRAIPSLLRQRVIEPAVAALPARWARHKTAAASLGLGCFQERMARWFGAMSRTEVAAFTGRAPALLQGESAYPFLSTAQSALRRVLYFDQTSWLPDNLLERGDRMTMGHSIESRLPFLDYPLVEYVGTLPDHLRLRVGRDKWVLREAMRGVLPEAILQRPKNGFRMPVDQWLRGPMREFLDDHLLGADARVMPLLRRGAIERTVREHRQGAHNHDKLLWSLLNLEVWARACEVSA